MDTVSDTTSGRSLIFHRVANGYLSAVDAAEHSKPDDIRGLLVRQLSSPVRWTQTVTALSSGGITDIVECGPGGVLSGLVKRIEKGRDTRVFTLDSLESLETALAAVAA